MHTPSRYLGYILRRLVPNRTQSSSEIFGTSSILQPQNLGWASSVSEWLSTKPQMFSLKNPYYHQHKRTNTSRSENAVAKVILSSLNIQCWGESSTGDMPTERYKGQVINMHLTVSTTFTRSASSVAFLYGQCRRTLNILQNNIEWAGPQAAKIWHLW